MFGFQVNFDLIVDALFALCLLLGCTSAGYLFLRAGWPKIRILERQYKMGWSVILGALFTVAVIGSAFLLGFLKILPMPRRNFMFIALIGAFAVALSLLTLRRKFFAAGSVVVSVPKRVVGTKIVAEKVMEKIGVEKGFVSVGTLGEERVKELRGALGKGGTAAHWGKAFAPAAKPASEEAKQPLQGKPARGWFGFGKPAQAKPAGAEVKPPLFGRPATAETKPAAEKQASAGGIFGIFKKIPPINLSRKPMDKPQETAFPAEKKQAPAAAAPLPAKQEQKTIGQVLGPAKRKLEELKPVPAQKQEPAAEEEEPAQGEVAEEAAEGEVAEIGQEPEEAGDDAAAEGEGEAETGVEEEPENGEEEPAGEEPAEEDGGEEETEEEPAAEDEDAVEEKAKKAVKKSLMRRLASAKGMKEETLEDEEGEEPAEEPKPKLRQAPAVQKPVQKTSQVKTAGTPAGRGGEKQEKIEKVKKDILEKLRKLEQGGVKNG